MTDKKLKFVAHPLRQIIWNHLARYCCLSDGRQYQHLIAVIKLLRNIVGDDELKEYYGDNFSNIINILKEFEIATNHIIAFCSILNQKDYRNTNFYDRKFRIYYASLQKLPLIHQEVLDVFVFLFDKTTLQKESIPSSYIAQASAELTFKSEDEERKQKTFLSKREKESERLDFKEDMEMQEKSGGEENED